MSAGTIIGLIWAACFALVLIGMISGSKGLADSASDVANSIMTGGVIGILFAWWASEGYGASRDIGWPVGILVFIACWILLRKNRGRGI